jgi:hypothetical protein
MVAIKTALYQLGCLKQCCTSLDEQVQRLAACLGDGAAITVMSGGRTASSWLPSVSAMTDCRQACCARQPPSAAGALP